VADQAGGDGDKPPAQGGDHGLTSAGTVSDQPPVAAGGGEVVQPAGAGSGEQRSPHPGPVHRVLPRREVAQRGAVLGVAEQILHAPAVAVPVLDLRGVIAGGHVEVGHDERGGVDRVGVGKLVERQGALVRVQGAGCVGAGLGDRR